MQEQRKHPEPGPSAFCTRFAFFPKCARWLEHREEKERTESIHVTKHKGWSWANCSKSQREMESLRQGWVGEGGLSEALMPTSLPPLGPVLLGTVMVIPCPPCPPPPVSASLWERCQNNLASLVPTCLMARILWERSHPQLVQGTRKTSLPPNFIPIVISLVLWTLMVLFRIPHTNWNSLFSLQRPQSQVSGFGNSKVNYRSGVHPVNDTMTYYGNSDWVIQEIPLCLTLKVRIWPWHLSNLTKGQV